MYIKDCIHSFIFLHLMTKYMSKQYKSSATKLHTQHEYFGLFWCHRILKIQLINEESTNKTKVQLQYKLKFTYTLWQIHLLQVFKSVIFLLCAHHTSHFVAVDIAPWKRSSLNINMVEQSSIEILPCSPDCLCMDIYTDILQSTFVTVIRCHKISVVFTLPSLQTWHFPWYHNLSASFGWKAGGTWYIIVVQVLKGGPCVRFILCLINESAISAISGR